MCYGCFHGASHEEDGESSNTRVEFLATIAAILIVALVAGFC